MKVFSCGQFGCQSKLFCCSLNWKRHEIITVLECDKRSIDPTGEGVRSTKEGRNVEREVFFKGVGKKSGKEGDSVKLLSGRDDL